LTTINTPVKFNFAYSGPYGS